MKTPSLPLGLENLEDIEGLIRSGQSAKAMTHLLLWVKKRSLWASCEPQILVKVAALCRRSGWNEGGLLILNSRVRFSAPAQQATSEEIVEYATCLSNLGLVLEAQELLKTVEVGFSGRYLVEAYSYVPSWNYEAALPLLRKYLSLETTPSYSRLIVLVNLAATLVFLKFHNEATDLLGQIQEECKKNNYYLLMGNSHELLSQIEIAAGRFGRAQDHLNKALDLMKDHRSVDKLFALKWQAFLGFKQKGITKETYRAQQKVKLLAQQNKIWETWRALDYLLALVTHRQRLIEDIYFGTPHLAFRQRMEQSFNYTPSSQGSIRKMAGRGPARYRLDVGLGKLSGPRSCSAELKIGQSLHRLLLGLSKDTYRPMTVPTLFREISPQSFYNPLTSPAVVHQTLKRLRGWLESEKIPLLIEEQKGFFCLKATDRLDLHIPYLDQKNHTGVQCEDLKEQGFRHQLKGVLFSRSHICEKFGLSDRAANLKIKKMLERGILVQLGRGPQTRYQFVEKNR